MGIWDTLKDAITSIVGGKKKEELHNLRLVIGLNQVDKIVPDGWDEKLNAPKKESEEQIVRKCEDIKKRISQETGISKTEIEYYSALKRYRLLNLLNTVIQSARAGFKLENVDPKDPFELADPEVKKFADEQRQELNKTSGQDRSQGELLSRFGEILPEQDLESLISKVQQEIQTPPKVAILGKSGVGKTTTINNLFDAKLKTSPTTVGTTQAEIKEFELPDGGSLTVVDLPGYGRSNQDDKEYEKNYEDLIPSCDLVLLIVQANSRDLADDIEMIRKIMKLLENHQDSTE